MRCGVTPWHRTRNLRPATSPPVGGPWRDRQHTPAPGSVQARATLLVTAAGVRNRQAVACGERRNDGFGHRSRWLTSFDALKQVSRAGDHRRSDDPRPGLRHPWKDGPPGRRRVLEQQGPGRQVVMVPRDRKLSTVTRCARQAHRRLSTAESPRRPPQRRGLATQVSERRFVPRDRPPRRALLGRSGGNRIRRR